MIGLIFFDPWIVSGRLKFFFNLNFAPNLDKGEATLLKSLLDKLLSPTNLIVLVELIIKPRTNLPRVAEFLAFITVFFLKLYPFIPFPKIIKRFFFRTTFIPNFLIISIAANTSSDINKFFAFEIPEAIEANKTHLILILLSPLTKIFFLKLAIFFFNYNTIGHID